MVAPSGLRGVQVVPKAAHSLGLIRPWSTSPLRHSVDSRVVMPVTEKRCSASYSRNASDSRQPLSGMVPIPRQVRSATSKTSSSIRRAAGLPVSRTARG